MKKLRKSRKQRKEEIGVLLALSSYYLLIGAMIAWKIIFRQ